MLRLPGFPVIFGSHQRQGRWERTRFAGRNLPSCQSVRHKFPSKRQVVQVSAKFPRYLTSGVAYTLVAIVHCETSSGVMNLPEKVGSSYSSRFWRHLDFFRLARWCALSSQKPIILWTQCPVLGRCLLIWNMWTGLSPLLTSAYRSDRIWSSQKTFLSSKQSLAHFWIEKFPEILF